HEFYKAGVARMQLYAGGEGPIGSGGRPGSHAGYQVPLARKIKEALGVPVIAVGRLDDSELANSVIGNEDADLVAIGRAMLRNPYWALDASTKVHKEISIPRQYERGFVK
ncbi:oxidoreductase, partial [Anaerosporobacter sp.]